ncbi:MAG: hypothetical protein ABIY71_09650 [Flavobacteriales bacterium]
MNAKLVPASRMAILGMYPNKAVRDSTTMDRRDTATNPNMDGKP